MMMMMMMMSTVLEQCTDCTDIPPHSSSIHSKQRPVRLTVLAGGACRGGGVALSPGTGNILPI